MGGGAGTGWANVHALASGNANVSGNARGRVSGVWTRAGGGRLGPRSTYARRRHPALSR